MRPSGAGQGRASGAGGVGPALPRDLPAMVRDWPAEAREELAEREAILEFDARMSPERAKRAAENIVREQWKRQRTRSPVE